MSEVNGIIEVLVVLVYIKIYVFTTRCAIVVEALSELMIGGMEFSEEVILI
jgi:hypothetical protein